MGLFLVYGMSSEVAVRRCDFPLGVDSISVELIHYLSSTIAERLFSFEVQGDSSGWSRTCLIVASNYQRTWTGSTLPYAHGGVCSHGRIIYPTPEFVSPAAQVYSGSSTLVRVNNVVISLANYYDTSAACEDREKHYGSKNSKAAEMEFTPARRRKPPRSLRMFMLEARDAGISVAWGIPWGGNLALHAHNNRPPASKVKGTKGGRSMRGDAMVMGRKKSEQTNKLERAGDGDSDGRPGIQYLSNDRSAPHWHCACGVAALLLLLLERRSRDV
ncbi:hypothetical protein DFH94DRAFT_683233 [Russula ochroleuca]|uniref:Uncharacterized protein n=1 Tax=Russula ochroleuca TaxID=152965 RepID=A0A9P5MT57_9AGAM|nr:hypothetical protein DFH94DRAFT_683233 [Russula ochroleuca]